MKPGDGLFEQQEVIPFSAYMPNRNDDTESNTSAGGERSSAPPSSSPPPFSPPPPPEGAVRVTLRLSSGGHRIDAVLLEELRNNAEQSALRNISRAGLKRLFKERRIVIKGQSAVPSSSLAAGTTFVDILGFA
jgi:hypothetical protein